MGGYISYIPLVIIFASQGVWLSQVNQRLGLAFLQQLPSGRRPDGVLPWAWRKNSSLPLKAWCLKRFSWACFTLKWRVKHKAWKKTRWKQGWITLTFIYNHNYMYIYIYVCVVVPRCCSCFFFWESFMSRRAPFIHLECWIFDQQNGCLFWLSRMALVTSIRSIDIWLQGAASFDTVSSPYYTPKSAISKTCTEHLPNLNLTSYLLCY